MNPQIINYRRKGNYWCLALAKLSDGNLVGQANALTQF
jgi:hypothetical protein